MSDLVTLAELLPRWLQGLIGCTMGLIIGSFLATVIVRWPLGISAAEGRSRCDACHRQLTWAELVPMLGYALRRGRCASCSAPIDRTHILMEVGCGLIGAVLGYTGLWLSTPFAWIALALAVLDAKHFWLPNRLVVALAIAAITSPPLIMGDTMTQRIAAGVGAALTLWLVARIFQVITGRTGLGGGDPKLFGALAVWSGPWLLPTLLLSACLVGLVDFAVRLRRAAIAPTEARNTSLPFGTYLVTAALALLLAKALDFSLIGIAS